MFPKHAETVITRGTQPLGNSLRVGEAPRVVTSLKKNVTKSTASGQRFTRTDRATTGGVTRNPAAGVLNTGITGGNIGGGGITNR